MPANNNFYISINADKLRIRISKSMKKSTTQMTKAELFSVLKEKDDVIASLNARVDELENMAVRSRAIPMDADGSRMLTMMNQRIKALEEQINAG